MRWVKLNTIESEEQIYGRIDDDGKMRVTCVLEHPELQEWFKASPKNVAVEAD